jgi:hypothetical protein
MRTIPPQATLQYLFGLLEAHNPELLTLLTAENEADFLSAVEQSLCRAVNTIQSGAKQYGDMEERGLSLLLADLMNHSGLSATAERYNNGHVDIVVEHLLRGRWKYLGECKIHRGYQYHVEGCKQVLGYCGGDESRVFCLDFFRVAEIYESLKQLREQFDEQLPLKQTKLSADHATTHGSFLTAHAHVPGKEIEILHVGCNISPGHPPSTASKATT